ncbi:MAG: DNA translocase FtsK 4TM domain-containing protein [Acidobacteriota bacterium]|nr:DNA translocase FtsK 4TM domain-containing protein [Acidobacteriota bacterium]HOY98202.1 DNA translocase FtsK 4TM domain-containing protein [Candidatus Aminicenantes bacterium]MDD8030159.1 DNA translocase FtsK 4TM domain-containing protein [Acidobacteriota bacterium]MDD8033238.1 DNA translocase FtsK 4TM domain-containing protein [Acidobacteriota bacterium]MDD8039594.1 DNA translocase FtsK 4TM domain-containing protein [Acidobacteriota bacterium]
MSKARRRKTNTQTASKAAPRRRFPLSEAVGILLVFAALFSLAALISYNSLDPSWASAAPGNARIDNWGGRIGAETAETAYAALGLAAWLLPLAAGYLGIRAILHGNRRIIFGKAGQFILLLLILCPLLDLFFQNIAWGGKKIPVGGVLGQLLVSFLHGFFGSPGTLIFLLAAASLFAVAVGGFSFKKLFLGVGRMTRFTVAGVKIRIPRRPKPEKPAREKKASARAKAEPAAAPAPARAERREPSPPPRRELRKAAIKPPLPPVARPEQYAFPQFDDRPDYTLPPLTLLDPGAPTEQIDRKELQEKRSLIEEKLAEFKVEGEVREYHPGPVITTYEYSPKPGIKINQVTNLSDDLALALGAESVRIQRIPGKSSLGVEIPNNKREIIKLRDILESEAFIKSPSKLTLALGKTVHDEVYVTDLGVMPHLLVAGATGTGKSVCLNALIASILYKASPEEVKLLLIDPKRLEFSLYDGIPHLLSPVINDAKKAAAILMDTVKKMEERYYLMQQAKVRNIDQYNHHIADQLREKRGKLTEEEQRKLRPMPYIVIIIDELADLIMVSGQDVDFAIGRLAQLARAVGIHLVLATQRPSTDIITGTIKNNFPSRIAFRVPSKIDSRVILDENGAEKLLGMGDMLFIPPNYPRLVRLHCSYVSIPEVRRLVNFVKKQGTPDYDERIVDVLQRTGEMPWGESDEKDEMFEEAVKLILHTGQASASYLQRRLKLGYARASRLIDQMEQEGILGPSEGSKPREILVDVKSYMLNSAKKNPAGD